MKKGNLLSVLAILLSLVAVGMCVLCCSSKDKMVAEALNKNPSLVIEALQKYEQQARDQQFAALEGIIAENADKLNNNPASPFVGPESAKANLVMFFDYSCGYCHRLYPVLRELINKNPNVKFVFKPLTFLGPVSEYAAKAALAANEQGKFLELNDAMFNFEGQLTETKIDELAVKSGLDLEKFKASVASDKVNSELSELSDLANTIQVQGVPTMILGGKVLQTFDAKEIQAAIDAAGK